MAACIIAYEASEDVKTEGVSAYDAHCLRLVLQDRQVISDRSSLNKEKTLNQIKSNQRTQSFALKSSRVINLRGKSLQIHCIMIKTHLILVSFPFH